MRSIRLRPAQSFLGRFIRPSIIMTNFKRKSNRPAVALARILRHTDYPLFLIKNLSHRNQGCTKRTSALFNSVVHRDPPCMMLSAFDPIASALNGQTHWQYSSGEHASPARAVLGSVVIPALSDFA